MNKNVLAIIIGVFIIGSVLLLVNLGPSDIATGTPKNNVSVIDGKQIIELQARGGYLPRTSVAQAGIPTVIRFKTKGTFDCSSAIRIPSLNITQMLPQTGSTDIDIGSQPAGILQGSCGMGMYPFEIQFIESDPLVSG